MKRRIRLTEADLHNIINEVISEATGTPSKWDETEVNALQYGDIDTNFSSNVVRMKYLLRELNAIAYNAFKDADTSKQLKRYFDVLCTYLKKSSDIIERVANSQIMRRGEQPDKDYYDKHQKHSKVQRNSSDHDYPTYDTYH